MLTINKKHNRYESYKNSGIDWLGEIPSEWDYKRLYGVCKFIRGNSSFQKNDVLSNGKYVALHYGKTYKVEEINEEFQFYVNDEFYKSSQVVNYGEVIFVSTSETTQDLGHSVFYNRDEIGLIGGEQILLKPNKYVLHGKYLFYSSKVFRKELAKFATGIKVFRFNIYDLKTINLSLPPLPEQEKIANYLDEKTFLLDKTISAKKKQIALLKEKRVSLINNAVTKGLDESIEMKESGNIWFKYISNNWESVKSKYITTFLNGYAFDSNTYQDNGLPIIRIGNVGQSIDIKNTKKVPFELRPKIEKFKVNHGDILLALTGATIGKSSVYDVDGEAYLNQRVAIVRGNKKLTNRFLSFLIQSDFYKENIRLSCFGGAQENISKTEIGNIFLSIPPLQEQKQIVEYLDQQTEKIDTTMKKIEESIILLEEYKTAMISSVVTGKVRV